MFLAAAEVKAIQEQFPSEPLAYLPKTLRIPFEEGMRLLQEAGFEVCPNSFLQRLLSVLR